MTNHDDSREAARRRDGRFGAQHRAEASVELGGYTRPLSDMHPTPGTSMVRSIAHRDRDLIKKELSRSRTEEEREAAQGRAYVNTEVDILLSTRLAADYTMTSPFRRATFRWDKRTHSDDFGPRSTGDIGVERAIEIRDFCFTQAARFGSDARVGALKVVEDESREAIDAQDVHEMDDSRAQAAHDGALADSYAYWACAIDAGSEPDPDRLGRLQDSIREPNFERSLANRWRGDPAPERSAEWERATGAPPEVDTHYDALPEHPIETEKNP